MMWPRLVGVFLFAGVAFAQEAETTKAEGGDEMWKLINFAIFAALLGYGLFKGAPAFFNARSSDIQKAIQEATGLKMEADLRHSEIDRKMASLAQESERLHETARREMTAERGRVEAQTVDEIEYIRKSAMAEIETLELEGQLRLRWHATRLALDLAEKRLQDRFAAGEPTDLMADFVRLVEQGKN